MQARIEWFQDTIEFVTEANGAADNEHKPTIVNKKQETALKNWTA